MASSLFRFSNYCVRFVSVRFLVFYFHHRFGSVRFGKIIEFDRFGSVRFLIQYIYIYIEREREIVCLVGSVRFGFDLIVISSVRFDSGYVSADETDGSVPGICKYSPVRFGSVPGIHEYSAVRFGPVSNLILI